MNAMKSSSAVSSVRRMKKRRLYRVVAQPGRPILDVERSKRSTFENAAVRDPREKTAPTNDPNCGRWDCRKCSCSRYSGTEVGGYKCNNCGHYYEDHRS